MSFRADFIHAEEAQHIVPRGHFVPPSQQAKVSKDAPLPIGCGQTISQPSLVAFMTAQLALTPRSRVLEVGTGSGYQTAILAELAGEVFSIERIPQLAAAARMRLAELGYKNIVFRIGDGASGWPEMAPFDAVIVTAAARHIPPALPGQLKPGGRMIVPVGESGQDQILVLIEKNAMGRLRRFDLCSVRFVPLISDRE